MTRSLLAAFILLLFTGTAFAQAGSLGVYADSDGTNWNLIATGGLLDIYILHQNTPGSTYSTFQVIYPEGITLIADSKPYPWFPYVYIGASNIGVTVDYNRCESGSFPILRSTNVGVPTKGCDCIWIVPHPLAESGRIEVIDCSQNKLFSRGFGTTVRAMGYPDDCWCYVSPTAITTWGHIKAMYR